MGTAPRRESVVAKLYRGDTRFNVVGRRKYFYAFSLTVILIGMISLGARGFNLSIDFKGGDAFQFAANGHSVTQAQDVMAKQNVQDPVVQKIGEGQIRVQTKVLPSSTSDDEVGDVTRAIAKEFGLQPSQVSVSSIGASWGSEITKKAIEGLIIFLVLTVLYIAARFEAKMAMAAIIALIHDLVITAGIYSLVGFQVSPSTVIALLTILGFSLYDTIVVFDRVRETTGDLNAKSNRTYTTAANVALNETLMRSINTSLISLLPVAALLFVGAGLLGAGSLEDLALAQFVGLAAGAYSSIFIATPLLAQFKEREPAMRELRKRVDFLVTHKPTALDKEEAAAIGIPVPAAAMSSSSSPMTVPVPEPTGAPTYEPPADDVAESLPSSPVAGIPASSATDFSEHADPPARVPGSPMPRQGGSPRRKSKRGRGRPSGKRSR
ncbi:MAG TPA: protein translocase subunit SecF [Mycobacteriales bacterium]